MVVKSKQEDQKDSQMRRFGNLDIETAKKIRSQDRSSEEHPVPSQVKVSANNPLLLKSLRQEVFPRLVPDPIDGGNRIREKTKNTRKIERDKIPVRDSILFLFSSFCCDPETKKE
jgi:hypothetical protein